MILTALHRYYQRLLDKPSDETGLPQVPSYGFSEEKIGYVLLLSKNGQVVDIQSNMDHTGKKAAPRLMSVPQPVKRTSGIKPNFLWDKTAYVLGIEGNKDKATSKENPWLPSLKAFEAFKQFHLETLTDAEDEGLLAFRQFVEQWQPEKFNHPPFHPEIIDANLAFRLDGQSQYLHNCSQAQSLWAERLAPDDNAYHSMCLVSGQNGPVARLHPSIKGVYGGQSSGGSIVSFNSDAYISYNKEQGHNAPVSEFSAFAYTTALNYLLRRDKGKCVSIGDTSTVFWAEADNENEAQEAEDLFSCLLMNTQASDRQEDTKIRQLLEQLSKGKPLAGIAPDISLGTRFYILGLAPNAARISIRYWMDTTLGALAENNRKHWLDLQLNPPAWKHNPPNLWSLLIQTTPKRKNAEGGFKKSDSKDIPPQLAGEFARAVLLGSPYPLSMLAQLLVRIRSDGAINPLRVAMIKAILNRNFMEQKKEVSVGLNKEEKDMAYRLGRLFAVLEKAQSANLGKVNASIRDRFYAGASSTPNSIFPMLLRNYRNHVASLRKGKKAEWVKDPQQTAGWLEKEVSQIIEVFDSKTPFPKTMNMAEQGRFVVGYYHQMFTRHGGAPEDVNIASTEADEAETHNDDNQGN